MPLPCLESAMEVDQEPLGSPLITLARAGAHESDDASSKRMKLLLQSTETLPTRLGDWDETHVQQFVVAIGLHQYSQAFRSESVLFLCSRVLLACMWRETIILRCAQCYSCTCTHQRPRYSRGRYFVVGRQGFRGAWYTDNWPSLDAEARTSLSAPQIREEHVSLWPARCQP